jgi:N-acetylneuraminic acid mutarotase
MPMLRRLVAIVLVAVASLAMWLQVDSAYLWLSAGDMSNGRSQHTATVLPDGRVLVVGGISAAGVYLASADIYNPTTNSWTAAAPMASARAYHTATVLPSGRVMVVGGHNGSTGFKTRELYDPATNTWLSNLGAQMQTSRAAHQAVLLDDGRLMVIGGTTGPFGPLTETVEIYSSVNNDWDTVAPVPLALQFHTATKLADGRVLVAGGYPTGGGSVANAQIYSPSADTWTPVGNLNKGRQLHQAVRIGSKVLVAGGVYTYDPVEALTSTEEFDPLTNIWTTTGDMPVAAYALSAVTLTTGEVLAAGGGNVIGSPPTGSCCHANAQLYDPVTGTWTSTAAMSTGRSGAAMILLPGGVALITGGVDGTNPSGLASAETFHLDTDADSIPDRDDNCDAIPNGPAETALPGIGNQTNTDNAPLSNGTMVPGDDITILLSDAAGNACDDDDDNDGLTDIEETSLPGPACPFATMPTDPLDMDTDGGHRTDGWECANGTDPNSTTTPDYRGTTPPPDLDSDNIPGLWEARGYNASSSSSDSDGDGCGDMIELGSVDGNRTVNDADRLAVARRALGIFPPDPDQDYVLDIDKNGTVGDPDRLFVARAALLPAPWVPKTCETPTPTPIPTNTPTPTPT